MQVKATFITPSELDKLARRFQRIATGLTRLARVAHDHPVLLKIGSLRGVHLTQIERAWARVSGSAAVQVAEHDPEIGRSLIA